MEYAAQCSEAVFCKDLLYAMKWIQNNAGLRVNLRFIIAEQ